MLRDIIEKNAQIKASDGTREILRRYFPGCFDSKGNFDLDRFRVLVSDEVDIRNEGYALNFLGKSYARLLASVESTTVIVPDTEHNSRPENVSSKNIYITGDNLDALKHLLKSYYGQVKCIYIDPPYNTGSDGFVYNDNFSFTSEELQIKLGISQEQADKILDLTKRGSASHSAWLMFMMPRLQLARDLLSDDGVIFISIDDNEQANLKLLCDSIFGEENLLMCVPRITKRGGKSSDILAQNHDYVFLYAKSEKYELYPIAHDDSDFKYKDEYFDKRGYYKLNQTLDYDSLRYSKELDYPIEVDGEIFYPGGEQAEFEERKNGNHDRADWCWRWSKEKYEFGLKNGFVEIKRSAKSRPRIYTKTYQKAYINDDGGEYVLEYGDRTKALSTLEFVDNVYSNDNAAKDIVNTMSKKVFDYTKPLSLIETILDLSVKTPAIVVDFFSGSGTTAEAVMQWNATSEDKRAQYIMVQLPETVKDGTVAQRMGFNTIDEIGMERIKRAAARIKAETGADIDYGFKHYTLKEPSDRTLEKLELFDPSVEFFADGTVLEEFGPDTVLETWQVRDGYGLGAESQPVMLDTYTARFMDKHLYMIDTGFTEDDMAVLMEKYLGDKNFNPENIVLLGYSFTFAQTEMLRKNLVTLRDAAKNLRINIDIRY